MINYLLDNFDKNYLYKFKAYLDFRARVNFFLELNYSTWHGIQILGDNHVYLHNEKDENVELWEDEIAPYFMINLSWFVVPLFKADYEVA